MRLPVPGPRDVWQLLERGGDAVEQLLGAVPRMVALLDEAERLVRRAARLVDDIDATRTAADAVVERTDQTVTRADDVVDRSDALMTLLEPLNARLGTLLDALEPPLTRLQPVLDRLAETTSPQEVDAAVELIDHLPSLAHKMEVDIVPVLDSLSTVSPDLRDLLEVSRELNEMLAKIPGMSRVKERVERQQALDGRE